MEKKTFSIIINASREKVWKVLFDDETYRQWTTAFSAGSYAQTDWQEGSKALFTDGSGYGMVARIEKNDPNEFLSIEHLGEIRDGVEDTTSDKVKEWAGAHENYTLKDANGQTELIIDMDIDKQYEEMFSEMWPKALANVKALAER